MSDLSSKERDNLLVWDGRRQGFYEVYYLKWNDAASRTAGWVRYTLTSPATKELKPYCELWGIFFDAEKPRRNFAVKHRFPIFDLSWKRDSFQIGISEAELTMDHARGTIRDGKSQNSFSWDLGICSKSETYRYFPSERFYTGGFPKTKGLSPHMNARFNGTVTANGRIIDLADAPGQQTHLWGTQHAQRWVWGHCNTFTEDPDAVWEGLDSQVKLGPFTSPHFKLFYLRTGGRTHLFNAPALWFRNRSRWDLGRWEFAFANSDICAEGIINCEYDQMVAVTYTDPDGQRLWCNNSKVASISLKLSNAQGDPIGTLSSPEGCAAEFVDRKIFQEVPVRI